MKRQATHIMLAAAGLVTVGLAGLVWQSERSLDEARAEAEAISQRILAERRRLEGTPGLEQEVLVFREISGRMAAILPDEEELNQLVRNLQEFSEESGVKIHSLRRAAVGGHAGSDGDLRGVSYVLELEADAFELLAFLDRVETSDRFLRIPRLKVTAAREKGLKSSDQRTHSIRLEVETFVFEPGAVDEQIAIEWADWKLKRLRGDVARRRTALEPMEYAYRGRRGRRDPWVDPRRVSVPKQSADAGIEGARLTAFAARVAEAWSSWRELEDGARSLEGAAGVEELEAFVVGLEAEGRRFLDQRNLDGDAARLSLTAETLASLEELRAVLDGVRGNRGPSMARLREVHKVMEAHAAQGEHTLALEAVAAIAPDLEWLSEDPERAPLVAALVVATQRSQAVIDFDAMGNQPRGVVILGARAAVLIGSRAFVAGDRIGEEVIVHSVTAHEVVFEFRGQAIARRVQLQSPLAGER